MPRWGGCQASLLNCANPSPPLSGTSLETSQTFTLVILKTFLKCGDWYQNFWGNWQKWGHLEIMRAHRGRVLDEELGPTHLVLVGVHLNAPDVMLAFKWKPSFSRCFWFSAGSGKGVIYKWRGTLGCVWWLAGSGLDQTCPSLEKSLASESHTFKNDQLSHPGMAGLSKRVVQLPCLSVLVWWVF